MAARTLVCELIGSTRQNNTHVALHWDFARAVTRARAQTLHFFARHLRAHQHLSAPSRIHKNGRIKIHFNVEQRRMTHFAQTTLRLILMNGILWQPAFYNQESAPENK